MTGTMQALEDMLVAFGRVIVADFLLRVERKQLLAWEPVALLVLLLFIYSVKKVRRHALAFPKVKHDKNKMIEADSPATEQSADGDAVQEETHFVEVAMIATLGAATTGGMIHKQGAAESRAKLVVFRISHRYLVAVRCAGL